MKPPNRFFLWSFPVLAIAATIMTYLMAVSGAARSSEDVMREFEADLALGGPSTESALLKIDMAFKLALAEEDKDQQALILKRRAKFYRDLRRYDRAHEDLELLLAKYLPNDQESIRYLARIEFDDGEEEAALARIEAELARDPLWVNGLTYRAEFRFKLASDILEECAEICAGAMNDAAAAHAAALTQMAASLLPSDPRRAALSFEITQLFPTGTEDSRREYNKLFSRASNLIAAAYGDNSKALERSNRTTAMLGILQILRQAWEIEDASDFAAANMLHLSRAGSNYQAEKYFLHLTTNGQLHEAAQNFPEFRTPGRPPSVSVLREALRTFQLTGSWKFVGKLANDLDRLNNETPKRTPHEMKVGRSTASIATFYRGLASHHLGAHGAAASLLRIYCESSSKARPYLGAYLDAEFALARSAAENPAPIWRKHETVALARALKRTDKAHGEERLRLVELQRDLKAAPSVIEKSLAHVMAAVPSRSKEFEPEWRSVGRRAIRQALLAPRSYRGKSENATDVLNPVVRGSFAIFEPAEEFAKEGEWYSVLTVCERVFKVVPYFTPAVELYLQACLNLELRDRGIELLLGRLEFLGAHPATVARLYSLRDHFTPEQELRLISAAPPRVGRNLIVHELIENKRYQEALLAFSNSRVGALDPEENLLLGQAQLGLNRIDEALLSLRRVSPESPHYPHAFGLLLQAAIETEDATLLDATISELARPTSPMDSDLIPIHDKLLVAGEFELANRLSTYLDSDVSTRSGQNMLRLASLQMRQRDQLSAYESLERAYAYRDDGGPTIGQLLIAIQNDDWDALPELLSTLDEDNPKLEIHSRMCIALLRGRAQVVVEYLEDLSPEERARGLNLLLRVLLSVQADPEAPILEEYPQSVRDETLAFLKGSPSNPRDSRQIIPLILALQHPDWLGWLVQELPDWNSSGLNMWVELLHSDALLRLKALAQADDKITRLVSRWPQFLASWELSSRLQFIQPLASEDLVRFAKNGWRAPGHPGALQLRSALDRIRDLRDRGENDQAMQAVRGALDGDPNSSPLLYQLGLIHQATGRYAPMIVALTRFLKSLPPRARDAILPEVIKIIDEAAVQGQIDYELRRQTLRGLSTSFPRNALVALKFAESDIDADILRTPVGAIQVAYERLEKFRDFTGNLPLEQLGEGGLAAWHEFYLKVDPTRCEQFARAELLKTPKQPELWAMLAESLDRQGRHAEADARIEFLLSVAPTERTLTLWIESLIRRQEPRSEVSKYSEMLAELRGIPIDHPEIRFWRALTKARSATESSIREGINGLAKLWKSRTNAELMELVDDPVEFNTRVGREFGVAAMRYGDREEHILAQKAFQAMASFKIPASQQRLYATLSFIGPHNSNAAVPEVVVQAAGTRRGAAQRSNSLTRRKAAAPKEGGEKRAKSSFFTPEQREEFARLRAANAEALENPAKSESGLPQIFTDEHLKTFDSLQGTGKKAPKRSDQKASRGDREPRRDQ